MSLITIGTTLVIFMGLGTMLCCFLLSDNKEGNDYVFNVLKKKLSSKHKNTKVEK